jgi:hypothetical protein
MEGQRSGLCNMGKTKCVVTQVKFVGFLSRASQRMTVGEY